MESVSTKRTSKRRITRVGIAGLAVAMIALLAAFLSPWIVGLLDPNPKPIEDIASDVALNIKARVTAKLKGEEYVSTRGSQSAGSWSKIYPAIVVGAAGLAVCLGVVGLVRKEDRRLNFATIGVGASAIIFQYFILIAATLLFILLIAVILSAFGVDLPS